MVNRAANVFRMAAQALKNSRSALGAFYRRLRSRLGTPIRPVKRDNKGKRVPRQSHGFSIFFNV